MNKKLFVTIKEGAGALYIFERSLNRIIINIGSFFLLMSYKGAKSLHTGQWRNYVFVIFYTIILFILLSFWMIRL